ncbi:DNA topoisomerase IB [uncultured Tateyamaria sp.]|uniref:DNA topoisomerase IB n=1 Tax=uncultured Tateyamaria sp. TaxID=455651 RepID=UPI002608B5D1|nr:DNA topoisomerase IB [uncultured Tateyamaria sp.]
MALVYYPDSNPGIARRPHGRGFSYFASDGTRIADRWERDRLASLAVPPAYRDVWMAPIPNAHLLATGRDDQGRKQYRYHPDWTAMRDVTKFDTLAQIGTALPRLRRWITQNLKGEPGAQHTAIAAALALIDRGALRPGNLAYTAANGTFGALTLEEQHLDAEGANIVLRYTAKGGKKVEKHLTGARLARVLHKSADLPGPRLFDYQTADGSFVPLRAEHLQDALSQITDTDMTPKTLRTWIGTLAAFSAARDKGPDVQIIDMTTAASDRLHNTPAIARTSYIHPDVIALAETGAAEAQKLSDDGPSELRQNEAALLRFLE